jgi:hypothetical protein
MKAPAHRSSSAAFTALLGLLLFSIASNAYADSGTISSVDKYAWGNVAGWINFAPTESVVTVSDTGLSGYAWSKNDGWIDLSPTEGGVTNNGSGALGGFAWDQSTGWVSFTGVTIDAFGTFHGEAIGSNGYAINFDCSTCDVQTYWRPAIVVNVETTSPPSSAISRLISTNNSVPSTTTVPVLLSKETLASSSPHGTFGTSGQAEGADSIILPALSMHSKPSIAQPIRRAPSNSNSRPRPTFTLTSDLRKIAIPSIVFAIFSIIAALLCLKRSIVAKVRNDRTQ